MSWKGATAGVLGLSTVIGGYGYGASAISDHSLMPFSNSRLARVSIPNQIVDMNAGVSKTTVDVAAVTTDIAKVQLEIDPMSGVQGWNSLHASTKATMSVAGGAAHPCALAKQSAIATVTCAAIGRGQSARIVIRATPSRSFSPEMYSVHLGDGEQTWGEAPLNKGRPAGVGGLFVNPTPKATFYEDGPTVPR